MIHTKKTRGKPTLEKLCPSLIFIQKSNLRQHMKFEHGIEVEKSPHATFSCQFCSFRGSNSCILQNHILDNQSLDRLSVLFSSSCYSFITSALGAAATTTTAQNVLNASRFWKTQCTLKDTFIDNMDQHPLNAKFATNPSNEKITWSNIGELTPAKNPMLAICVVFAQPNPQTWNPIYETNIQMLMK